jgi:thiol-disulfide isomerase/thioredoxin
MTGRKQLAVGLLVLGITGVVAFGASRYLRKELFPVQVGSKAPNFTAVTLDSVPREKSLAEYRGQVVMINVWATWCLPCRVEMPSIEQLHRSYASKGLKIVAVSVDDPGTDEAIREFVKEFGLTFEVLHDNGGQEGTVPKNYQTSGYPETVIVGRDGIIRKKLLGAHNWNSPENRALIERLLAEKAD